MAAALDPLVALDARVLDMEAVSHLLAALDVESLSELRDLVETGKGLRDATVALAERGGGDIRVRIPTEPRRSIA